MSTPSMSIAMATYNGARYLKEQLDSLDRQTVLPTELVVSDDQSSDETVPIIRAFARSARFPVRLTVQERRLGFRRNFLQAAGACRGEIVSFCDQDDVWHPGKLEAVRRVMADEPDVLLCFHNSTIVDQDRTPMRLFYARPPAPARSEPLTLGPQFRPFGYSQSLRADLLKMAPHGLQTGDWLDKSATAAHDVFFFCLASSLGRIAYLEQPLVEYRQHGNNTYGVTTAQPQPLARVRELLQDSTAVLQRYGRVSRQYAAAAREYGKLSTVVPEAATANAVDSWNLLSHAYRLRSEVRGGRSFLARFKAYCQLQRLGFYGETGFWTAGRKAGLTDLLAGVALAPLVRWIGAEAYAEGSTRGSRRRTTRLRSVAAAAAAPPARDLGPPLPRDPRGTSAVG